MLSACADADQSRLCGLRGIPARVIQLELRGEESQLWVVEEGRLRALRVSAACASCFEVGDWLVVANTPACSETSGEPARAVSEQAGEVPWPAMDQGVPVRLCRLQRPQCVRTDGDAWRWSTTRRMFCLRQRHAVLRILRQALDTQGFLEVETPLLTPAPSPEAVFQPLPAGSDYLITSPEFQLKRMLCGGFSRIYRLGPVFRGGECGAQHNPEFTLLEWYRVQADLAQLAADLQSWIAQLIPLIHRTLHHDATTERTKRLRKLVHALERTPYLWYSVADLFAKHLGMDLRSVTEAETSPAKALRAEAARAGISCPSPVQAPQVEFTALFSALWTQIEVHLPTDPFFVVDWPAPLASCAQLHPQDPTRALRMEFYAGGLELANGFVELNDPVEQRQRFREDLAQREALGLPPLPLDEAFLRALEEGMPPAAGMALGVDRLVMLICGTAEIREVLPFAWDER